MNCRLCGEGSLTLRLTLPNSPRYVARLEGPIDASEALDLSIWECDSCGLVQLNLLPEDGFYDDYVMTVSHSPQMQEYQRAQAIAFVEGFALHGKRVVELGCGDGNFLAYLRDAGADAIGIEPSVAFRELTQARGLPVYGGYVGRDPLPQLPYHAFVARQVLEHLADPNQFLREIYSMLEPMGVGLIEVPSLEQSLAGGRFYDFFPDHLNYFSRRTLRWTLERNGFEVISLERGMNGEYLVAKVRKDGGFDFTSLAKTTERIATEIGAKIAASRASGQRIAFWGAGGKGIASMAIARVREASYVVDSDPHKWGFFTPISRIPVVPPETLVRDPVDILIITALAYKQEVLNQLSAMNFQGQILALGEGLEVINAS